MNPKSRIKLIRSLEEIKLFEQNTYRSKTKTYYTWGIIAMYFVIAIFAYRAELKQNLLMFVFMVIPTIAYSIWLSFRNTLDERHKLLANAVLELGSIAQEEVSEESAECQPIKSSPLKKRTTRKKK